MVADAGWSRRTHKHSYNTNSSVRVIFGTATKAFLFLGVSYCSVRAINTKNEKLIPTHCCSHNRPGSSCSMKADIILEGFRNLKNVWPLILLVMGITLLTTVWYIHQYLQENSTLKTSVLPDDFTDLLLPDISTFQQELMNMPLELDELRWRVDALEN